MKWGTSTDFSVFEIARTEKKALFVEFDIIMQNLVLVIVERPLKDKEVAI